PPAPRRRRRPVTGPGGPTPGPGRGLDQQTVAVTCTQPVSVDPPDLGFHCSFALPVTRVPQSKSSASDERVSSLSFQAPFLVFGRIPPLGGLVQSRYHSMSVRTIRTR